MAREGQVSSLGLGRGVLLPACCEGRAKPGRAQLKPEPEPGTATPVVALASTASAVAHGDKALESTTNISCGDSSTMELQPQEGMNQSNRSLRDLSLPEESGTCQVSPEDKQLAGDGCHP